MGLGTGSEAETAKLSVEQPSSEVVEVVINQAVVINSDKAFREISVAQPDIADVAGINETSLYVLGKTPGITTLTLLDETGNVMAHVVVNVKVPPPNLPKTVRVRRGKEVVDEPVK
jgi:pilus assembly protein CpaC